MDRKWHLGKPRRYGLQRHLGLTIPRREAEIPIGDVVTPAKPFVGPRKNKGTDAAAFKRGGDLPLEGLRLGLFTVSPAVETQFSDDQRPLSCKVLQPCKIGLQTV